MMQTNEGYFILGTTESGSKFRPSDWVDRLATAYSSFANHRIHYHPHISPTTLDGQRCLFIDSHLAEQDVDTFNFIMQFAESNHLQVLAPAVEMLYSAA